MQKPYTSELNQKKYIREKKVIEKLLTDWYGEQVGRNELLAHLPDCEPFKNGVELALKKLVNKETAFIRQIKNQWHSIVGDQLAAYTKPSSFSKNTLYVEVSHSIWLMQLKNYNTDSLIQKIAQATNTSLCRKIRFTPQGSYSTKR